MTDEIAYWRQQQAVQQARNQRLAALARRDADRIAQFLRDKYDVQRVILFGSLVKGRFVADSDIDLAVEGLLPQKFFQAYGEMMDLSQFWIDLKPVESLHPHFYKRILDHGKIIYEKSKPN